LQRLSFSHHTPQWLARTVLPTSALEFDLPSVRIARRPVEPRDAARLMVVSRSDPARVEHAVFRDLPGLLRAGDRLVFNTTAVLPARLRGRRADSGGGVSGLYLADTTAPADELRWRVALRSNGRLRAGVTIDLIDAAERATGVALHLEERSSEAWVVRVGGDGVGGTPAVLARVGATPLPPYILKAREVAHDEVADDADRAWYQTVYATGAPGSVAAPTAGLHFTDELLSRVSSAGIDRSDITLHVGPGTFKPIESETVESHPMHAEWCRVEPGVVRALEATRVRRGRIIPVGTTSARTLESLPHPLTETERLGGFAAETRLLITPGFPYRWTDALITNFHLPRSTLLALVAALFPDGIERVLALYREAIRRGYRFYSYGDAMLILP